MRHQIKHRFTDAVLFECEVPDGIKPGLATLHAFEKATVARANLSGAKLAGANLAGAKLVRANLDGANLYGANLAGAKLARANLSGADLACADLARANLDGANLSGVNLAGANLAGADLDGANLEGAHLDGCRLVGERPIIQIGPIGSRCAYLVGYLTNQGVKMKVECFFGSLDEFIAQVQEKHDENIHGREYMAAVDCIKTHAELWTPAEQAMGV